MEISFEEYLETSYTPDREYLDGKLVCRNGGEGNHSYAQAAVGAALHRLMQAQNSIALVSQRTRVAPHRVRVPDVCVVTELEAVTTIPPQLCIEIWSPDDRWSLITPKVSDYLEMGVPCVWVIDPWSRRAWVFDAESGPTEAEATLHARHMNLEIPLEHVLPPDGSLR